MNRQGSRLIVIIFILGMVLAACSSDAEAPFGEELKQSEEVLIKQGESSMTLTDPEQIARLVDVLNEGKSIEIPDQAKEVTPEKAKTVTLIHFPNADLVYIGDGYLLNGLDGGYYEVPLELEQHIAIKE